MWSNYPVLNVLLITFLTLTLAGIAVVFFNPPNGHILILTWVLNLFAIGIYHLEG